MNTNIIFISKKTLKKSLKGSTASKKNNIQKSSNTDGCCVVMKNFKYENLGRAAMAAIIKLSWTYNHDITIDIWKNNDGTTKAIY